jgi:hypothetical protein
MSDEESKEFELSMDEMHTLAHQENALYHMEAELLALAGTNLAHLAFVEQFMELFLCLQEISEPFHHKFTPPNILHAKKEIFATFGNVVEKAFRSATEALTLGAKIVEFMGKKRERSNQSTGVLLINSADIQELFNFLDDAIETIEENPLEQPSPSPLKH